MSMPNDSGLPEPLKILATNQAGQITAGVYPSGAMFAESLSVAGGTSGVIPAPGLVPAPTGVTATDTAAVQAVITKLTTAGGNATLLFQDGTYQVDSNALVIRNCSNFAVRGTGSTFITQAPNRAALPNNTGGNLFTVADCTDFRVEGITFDGLRDTVSPITPLSASASSGQPSVTVAAGQGARYLAGQRLFLFGGLGTGEQNQSEGFAIGSGTPLVVSAITPGGGSGGGDLITFTTNLANSYAQISSTVFSDGFGPYAYAGAYLTNYQAGTATVAGRTLNGEDQQNGLHLLSCQRFTVTRVTGRNLWESGIKLGTGYEATSLTDGCSDGVITDCTAYHGYDQGISVWVSNHVTVKGNACIAAGWAGISFTGSDYCTASGNQILNSVYRVPGTVAAGSGIVTEGGLRNQIKGNIIDAPNQYGIQAIHSPMQWGIGGGYPTTSTFLEAGTAGGTSVQLSSTATMQVGGLYSLLDGAQTESVTVTSIVDGTHAKFAETLIFSHSSGIYIGRRIAQENVVEGNTIRGPGAAGINATPSVRSALKNNVIAAYGNIGIALAYITGAPYLPSGVSLGGDAAVIEGNTIGNGPGAGISAQGVSKVLIRGNRVQGTESFGGGIELHGVTDSVVSENQVTDINGSFGIVAENGGPGSTPCGRLTVAGNSIRRTHLAGISVQVGDSLTVSGNVVQACGAAATAGIDMQGVSNSAISGNICNSNQNAGILLEDNGSTYCLNNRVTGNTTRDDGTGYNIQTGASFTQAHGIVESGHSNFNIFTGNESDSNASDQLTTVGASSVVYANVISGALVTPPQLAVIDATAADILPLGTTAAGSTGKLADAGHVHPLTAGWLAPDSGWLEWNFDPAPFIGGQTALGTAGTIYLIRVNCRVARSITNVIVYLGTLGSSLTSGECFAGLYAGTTGGSYTAGGLVGTSADQTSIWNTGGSTGLKTIALTGGPFSVVAGYVWVSLLFNGTTGPSFGRAQTLSGSLANAGTPAGGYRWATSSTTGQTSLPASITPSGNVQAGASYWAAVS